MLAIFTARSAGPGVTVRGKTFWIGFGAKGQRREKRETRVWLKASVVTGSTVSPCYYVRANLPSSVLCVSKFPCQCDVVCVMVVVVVMCVCVCVCGD